MFRVRRQTAAAADERFVGKSASPPVDDDGGQKDDFSCHVTKQLAV